MVSRRMIALLVGLSLIGGYLLYGSVTGTTQPTLTVENNDTTSYQLSAYTVESREKAMYMNFRVTTREGERRLKTLSQLVWSDRDRNVTLADDGIPEQHITVAPGEEVTTTIDGWNRGDVTVYIIEEHRGNETHRQTAIKTCTKPGQEHSLTLEEDGSSGSSTCA
ncbi:hypothetical protein [Halorientalis salina]|uniref:hypothetical protein n=1 Tax=Halorientalis salina TaxID=2932266 RepID=UPI0010AC08F2|nr:hypothetical protein [Halorientalis salina]